MLAFWGLIGWFGEDLTIVFTILSFYNNYWNNTVAILFRSSLLSITNVSILRKWYFTGAHGERNVLYICLVSRITHTNWNIYYLIIYSAMKYCNNFYFVNNTCDTHVVRPSNSNCTTSFCTLDLYRVLPLLCALTRHLLKVLKIIYLYVLFFFFFKWLHVQTL